MFSKDIGIDLGTVNVLIYVKGEGIVLNEPSVIVIDEETKEVIAVGTEANSMLGKTPGKLRAIKPMKDGVIANFDMVESLLEMELSTCEMQSGKMTFRPLRKMVHLLWIRSIAKPICDICLMPMRF